MRIRWQIWFLLSFVLCASWSLYASMNAYSNGEILANKNWTLVKESGFKNLQEFCTKVSSENSTPKLVELKNKFSDEENPLFCSASLETAKKQYGLWAQKQAKAKSIRVTFTFIGIWLLLLLLGFGLSKLSRRRTSQNK